MRRPASARHPNSLAGAIRVWWRLLCVLALMITVSVPLEAQSLAPRAYWPAPRGAKVLSVGYSYQRGDVLTDPSLPIEDTESETHGLTAGYLQFFNLAGRTASVSVELPWASTSLDALLENEASNRDLQGLSDLSLRLAVNLVGAPSMTPGEFREFLKDPEQILGASLRIVAPTGAYDPDRVVNLGTNRWSVEPALGYIRQIRPGWVTELALGAWLYSENSDFQGQTREQDPLVAAEFHLVRPVRRTRSDFWVSLDLNFFYGARTRIDGEESDDLQRNSRIGLTLVAPFAKGNAVKIATSTSVATKTGGDYSSLVLAYQRVWR
jgi:hypothetical protein